MPVLLSISFQSRMGSVFAAVILVVEMLFFDAESLVSPTSTVNTRRTIWGERCRSGTVTCRQTDNDNEIDDHDEELFLSLFHKNSDSDGRTETSSRTESSLSFSSVYNDQDGAGAPRSELRPEDIVPLLMTALENNDVPADNAGLESMWEFATDTTKFVFQNNRTEYIESCHETAREFPTSFYGVAMNGTSWAIETTINRVGGNDGWIATQVMRTISSDGRLRRWQWELRKNKRPPCLGCWKVENIASSDRKGQFEPD